ncbi:MAG: CDP-glycerol glycerophosphotransferase family protein, partial [Enterococcus sp.]|nr:CDP-glycerol glycerophosphotransferase family protein [Enterococcus sp.]
MAKIATLKNKIRGVKDILNVKYLKFRELPIDERAILLEGGQGHNLNGNMFYLLKEIEENPKFKGFTPYYTVQRDNLKQAKAWLNGFGFKKFHLVIRNSKKYQKYLATSKYLFTDNSFPVYFDKRDSQVYINTGHASITDHMGRYGIESATSIGNLQKNYLMADYVLYPDTGSYDAILEDFMINGIAKNKELFMDMPRLDALRDSKSRERLRKILKLDDKQVIAYMPTWRAGNGRNADIEGQQEIAKGHLRELDGLLRDDQIVLVNFHFLV